LFQPFVVLFVFDIFLQFSLRLEGFELFGLAVLLGLCIACFIFDLFEFALLFLGGFFEPVLVVAFLFDVVLDLPVDAQHEVFLLVFLDEVFEVVERVVGPAHILLVANFFLVRVFPAFSVFGFVRLAWLGLGQLVVGFKVAFSQFPVLALVNF